MFSRVLLLLSLFYLFHLYEAQRPGQVLVVRRPNRYFQNRGRGRFPNPKCGYLVKMKCKSIAGRCHVSMLSKRSVTDWNSAHDIGYVRQVVQIMQEVVANLVHVKFDLEYAIEQQLGVQPLPFTGMDKSGAPICHFFKLNICQRGANCPFRHVLGDKAVVCKHWLRGLCKKGDQCEFLHEYDMSKMPECYFYARFGRCDNKDCQYQHIDPADKIKDCPWYDRGFCRHGALCKHRHRRKIMCMNFLVGFCPEGGKCKFTHPPWELPTSDVKIVKCTICNEYGHKSNVCPRTIQNMDYQLSDPTQVGNNFLVSKPSSATPVNVAKLVDDIFQQRNNRMNETIRRNPKPAVVDPKLMNRDMSRITCFRCGQKGHYASRCMDGGGIFASLPFRPTT